MLPPPLPPLLLLQLLLLLLLHPADSSLQTDTWLVMRVCVNWIHVSFSCSHSSAIKTCSDSFDSCLTCFYNIFRTFIVIFYKSYAYVEWHAVWVVKERDDVQTWKNIWHSEDRASWYILTVKANKMHYFSNLFDKALCMFRTCPLSIIRNISTLYTLVLLASASRHQQN